MPSCRILAIVVALVGLATAASAQQYTINALPAVQGQTDVYATGINNAGNAVGYVIDGLGNSRAVLWDSTGAHVLPDLSATGYSEAYRINNNGQIVGLSRNGSNFSQSVLWNDDLTLTEIGSLPGGGFSFANDINDAGVVVGSSGVAGGGQHAFTWTQAGGFVDYGSFDSASPQHYAGFNALNNTGLLVGTGYRLFSPFHAAMAQQGVLQVIDISPQAQFSTGMALDVNDAGVIVGYQNPGSGAPEAAIFHGDGTYTGLGHLGLGESWASAINGNGVIVGRAFGEVNGSFLNAAFVYVNGQMLDLMDLLPAGSGWELLFSADGINDQGQIVGSGIYNGEIRGYVITPVPEPGSLVILGGGGLALLRRRR